jgi:hypothetical protein
MGNKSLKFFFFANYFVGIIAVALSIETTFQLMLPLNTPIYYLLIFLTTVSYYTWAYSSSINKNKTNNPRTEWYRQHISFINRSQLLFVISCIVLFVWFICKYYSAIIQLSIYYWFLLLSVFLASLLYYGLLPTSYFRLNLRNTGWLKAFIIGFVWAGFVGILPIAAAKVMHGITITNLGLVLWLFIKNWMFCTVNAIMFDMKDYADDANQQLKTFVVSMGLRKTIFRVLIPLLLIGLIAFLLFVMHRHFGIVPILINLIPYLCLVLVAYSLQSRKKILYYLIVIDGLLLLKAVCGIIGMLFV